MARMVRPPLVLLAALLCACAAPDQRAAPGAPLLYVVNGRDGTITRLESGRGRVLGPPVPAGRAPQQIVASSRGALLVVPGSLESADALTRVARAGDRWEARPVLLEPGARVMLAAGDGGAYAAVAYHLRDAGLAPRWCGLALVDLAKGTLKQQHTVCGPGEVVSALALRGGAAGPVAYAGVMPESTPSQGRPYAGGRLVALDAQTGGALATLPLAGTPRALALAAAFDRPGQRLFCVEEEHEPNLAPSWRRMLAVDPATLDVEAVYPLAHEMGWLAVESAGRDAYWVAHPQGPGPSALMHLDLATGALRQLATVPGKGMGVAVTAERLFVAHPAGDAVWAFDRRGGRLLRTIPVGRGPVGIALSGR